MFVIAILCSICGKGAQSQCGGNLEEDVNQYCEHPSCSVHGEGKEDIPEYIPEKTHVFQGHFFRIDPKILALMLCFFIGPTPAFGIEGSPMLAITLENQPIFLAMRTASENITFPCDEQVTTLIFAHNWLCKAQDPVIPPKPPILPKPMTNTFGGMGGTPPMCSLSKHEHMTRDTPDKIACTLNTTYMDMCLSTSTAPSFVRLDSAHSCTYKKENHIFEHCCPAFNRLYCLPKSKKKSRRSQKKGRCNRVGKAKLLSADRKKKNETVAQQPGSRGWTQNPLECFVLLLSLRHSFKGLKSLSVWMIRLLTKKVSERLPVPAGDVPYCTAIVQHSSEHSCSIDRLSPSAQTADSCVSSQPTAGAADMCTTSNGGTTINVIRPTMALKDVESHQKTTQNDYECKYEMAAQQFVHSNQNKPISASEWKTPTSDNCSSDTPTTTLPCSDCAISSSGEWTQVSQMILDKKNILLHNLIRI